MATYDTIIIGAGGMGSAIACHLARRGQRVLAIDRFTPAHDKGSSHGRSRVIRKAYFEDPRYVPMLHRAYDLWRELEQETREKLLYFCGVLNMGPADHACIRGVRQSVTQHALQHEVLDAGEIERRWPVFRPHENDVGIFEADGGFHPPERAVRLHVQLAESRGAVFRWSSTVRTWTSNPVEVRVATDDAEYTARNLVISAGAWLETIAGNLGIPLAIERQVQLWWQTADPALFRHDRMPAFIHFTGDRAYYGIPALGDEGVKISRHHGGEKTNADEIDRSLRPPDEADVRDYLRRHVPAANGPLRSHAVCMYTNTPDDHFILDRHPQHENVIVAGGFSGHGFKFAPLVGEFVSEMITTGTSAAQAELFSIDRFRN